MDLGSLTGAAASIIAIATLAGLGLMRGTVVSLRESLGDARSEIADKDRRHEEEQKKIAELTADVTALNRIKSGEEHWARLAARLKAAEDHWNQLETDQKRIIALLKSERKGE